MSRETSEAPVAAAKTRDVAADIMRGIAIILVVYGHVARGLIEWNTASPATTAALRTVDFVIYTTHMPVFFAIAGYNAFGAIARRTAGTYARSRFWAIVYPYLIWSAVLLGSRVLAESFTHVNNPKPLSDMLWILVLPFSIFWFLYVLFVLQIAALAFARRASAFFAGAIVLLLVSALPGWNPDGVPYLLAVHTPFFAGGYILASREVPIVRPRTSALGLSVLVLAFAGFCALALSLGVERAVGLWTLPASIAGIALIAALSRLLAAAPVVGRHLAFLGLVSFPIYLIHLVPISIASRVLTKIGLGAPVPLILFGTLIGLYTPILLFRIAERLNVAGLLGLTGKAPFARDDRVSRLDGAERAR